MLAMTTTRAARGDDVAELVQYQCHAEQIDGQDRFGGGLRRGESGGVWPTG